MELILKRIAKKPGYTIGKLSIKERVDDEYLAGERTVYFCDTLEDTDRGLTTEMTPIEISKIKVPKQTAIPTGTYRIDMQTISRNLGTRKFYQDVCGGHVPRLEYVPGFTGVLIHCGNTSKDTEGCILVGENKAVGKVLNSRETFRRLYKEHLCAAYDRYEEIILTVQ